MGPNIIDENNLFVFLKEFYYPDLKRYDDRYNPTDCYSEARRREIELKVRSHHYEEQIIEEMKYRPLISRAAMTARIALYIIADPVGVYEWDLFRLRGLKWFVKADLPASTEFDDCRRICKKVSYLSSVDATPLFPVETRPGCII